MRVKKLKRGSEDRRRGREEERGGRKAGEVSGPRREEVGE